MCIECFNKKVTCEFCNQGFNKTYLSKHIKRCLIKITSNIGENKIINDKENNIINSDNDDNNIINNGTIIVGPSFCGRTHSLLNKLQLIRLCNSEKQIKIITRSPEQYSDFN